MYKLAVVDDEPEIRNGLCNYIPWKDLGFIVAGQFENGLQALDYIRRNPVDVILCDIKMPVMSGIDLARELHEKNNQAKIIFLSGYRDFEYARQALIYGVKNYIVKPTKYDEVVEVFSKVKAELDRENCSFESDDCAKGRNYTSQIISTVKNYVLEHFRDANLEDAGRLVHMNPYYLSKFFKENTGENFSDFVIAIRMKKAVELMNDISFRTYQISAMVGYSNPKNFARTFKKHFGKTPREFRNYKESGGESN